VEPGGVVKTARSGILSNSRTSVPVTLCQISPVVRGVSTELESSITGGLLCLLSLDCTTGELLCPQLFVLVVEALGEDGVNGFSLRGLRVVRLVHELSDGELSLSLLDVPAWLSFCLRGDLLRVRSLRGRDRRKERCRRNSLWPVINVSAKSTVVKETVCVEVTPPKPTVGEDSLSSSSESNDITPESTSCCLFASECLRLLASPLLCEYSACN